MTTCGKRLAAFAASVSLLMSACAGRDANPVSLTNTTDNTADCEMLQTEASINAQRINELTTEQGLKVAQNIVAGLTGAFFIIPLFLMDAKDAAGVEKRALEARNQYVVTLAAKRCDPALAGQIESTVASSEQKQALAQEVMQRRIDDANYNR
jgi:hypothetical protein